MNTNTKMMMNLGMAMLCLIICPIICMMSASLASASRDTVYCDGDGGSRTVQGKDLASCSVGDEGESSVVIVQQHDGSLVATVTTESFGGSYPTNCYDVKDKSQDEAGAPRLYLGKGFKLEIDVDAQATKNGFPGHANAPQSMAGLKNHRVECTLN